VNVSGGWSSTTTTIRSRMVISGSGQDPRLAECEAAYIARMSKAMARNVRMASAGGGSTSSIDARLAGAYVIGGLRRASHSSSALNPAPE